MYKQIYGQTSRDMRRLGRSQCLKSSVNFGLTPSDSVTRSPLYSIYGETISGVTILRAFGASSKFLRDMLKCVDTVGTPALTPENRLTTNLRTLTRTIGCGEVRIQIRNTILPRLMVFRTVNRWLSIRFNLLSAVIVGLAAFVSILTPTIDAALAGFILAFASTVTNDVSVAPMFDTRRNTHLTHIDFVHGMTRL
jgi:hypothetical protein